LLYQKEINPGSNTMTLRTWNCLVGATTAALLLAPSVGICSDLSDAKQKPVQISELPNYQSPGKPGAPVTMHYVVIDAKPQLGTETQISISYASTSIEAGHLSVAVTAGEGLHLVPGPVASEFLLDGANVPASQVITVRPYSEGLHYVNVTAMFVQQGRTQGRSFAIPVQVGSDKKLKQAGQGRLIQDADGNLLISMPAQES
jgi:hypothetical protein